MLVQCIGSQGPTPTRAMAQQGYATTAVCATYGGPLLTLCVGLGSAQGWLGVAISLSVHNIFPYSPSTREIAAEIFAAIRDGRFSNLFPRPFLLSPCPYW